MVLREVLACMRRSRPAKLAEIVYSYHLNIDIFEFSAFLFFVTFSVHMDSKESLSDLPTSNRRIVYIMNVFVTDIIRKTSQ